jgi:hypothetical protein
MEQQLDRIRSAKAMIDVGEEEKAEATAALMRLMEQTERVQGEGGKVAWTWRKGQGYTEWEKAYWELVQKFKIDAAEAAEIVRVHSGSRPGNRVFLYTAPKPSPTPKAITQPPEPLLLAKGEKA